MLLVCSLEVLVFEVAVLSSWQQVLASLQEPQIYQLLVFLLLASLLPVQAGSPLGLKATFSLETSKQTKSKIRFHV